MSEYKTCSVSLDTIFKFGPNKEDAACVDLDGEWSEQSKVFRHPDFTEASIEFISGEVGEGGDHVNITLKNISDKEVVIAGDKLVAFINEDPNATDPNLSKKKESPVDSAGDSMEVENAPKENENSDTDKVNGVTDASNGDSATEAEGQSNVAEGEGESMEVDDNAVTENTDTEKQDNDNSKGEEAIETSDQAEAENKEQENTSENVEESAKKDTEDSTKKETEKETSTANEDMEIASEEPKDTEMSDNTSEAKEDKVGEESTDNADESSEKPSEENNDESESFIQIGEVKSLEISDVISVATDDKSAETVSEKPAEESDEKSAEASEAKSSENDDKNEGETEGEKKEGETEADQKEEETEGDKKEEEKKKSPPPIMMRFVNETEAPSDHEMDEEEEDRADSPDDNRDDAAGDDEDAKSTTDSVHTELQVKEEEGGDKKPTLKLASFAAAKMQVSPTKNQEGESGISGCTQCASTSMTLRTAVVWEAMQFCSINCLSTYQTSMSSCSTCKQSVNTQLLGKYCVRFGSDIKQFCSNACLEDYKKGLKVCSYCQKDISGGEGFLAPIGNKGQFKDFCDQNCLHRFQELNKLKEVEKESGDCQVCRENGEIGFYLIRENETIKFCAKDSCLQAYKFANKVEAQECKNCKKCFDSKLFNFPIYSEGGVSWYCSQACQNVAIMISRKITPCTQCRVKKYNFDMIEVYEDSSSPEPNMYCSLHCRTVLKNNETAAKSGSGVPVISDIFSNVPPFSGGALPSLPTQPLPANQLKAVPGMPGPPPLQQMGVLPGTGAPMPSLSLAPSAIAQAPPQPPPPPQIQIQQQTVTEVIKEVKVLPPEVAAVKNKGLQTKPYMVAKAVSCKPTGVAKSTQTEGLANPTIIPIPIPIHMPTPCAMYNTPFPVLVPIPLPFPVPVFIPTTRNSQKGIMKQIKKIQNKIPADPFEAELLALAGNIAEEDKDSSASEYEDYDDDDGRGRQQIVQEPIPDLENEMAAERIVPKPLPISTPEPPPPRQFNFGGYPNPNKRERESDDEQWRPQNLFDQRQRQPEIVRQPQRRQRGRTTHQVKRQRTDSVQPAATPSIPQQPKERPDANHHLKFTYGVNAWKHWVVGKNAELEKQRAQGRYQKSFETDILKLRADELNFTLCMFVKEVKKPNGDAYAADSILYLVLGIQEYLFENGRIDNIFTDVYYDPFTTALHEVVKDFKLPVNELGYFVTRIEEEHLWESKQLGAHSPQVLLNTLVYFNTKYFQLKTPDEHLKLSFSHIMKHWKKTTITKAGEQQRTVLLRYYPPPQKGQKNEDRKMYEQHENTENPLRCPVKLYEFYLSKCPESTKNRNDMFYLQPERSCVPDSPVWYSQALLNKFNMEKMLARLLMVREVQEHMLADQ